MAEEIPIAITGRINAACIERLSATHPIIVGEGKLAMDFSRELFKEGVFVTGIAFPTVPEGKARLRTIMSATHTQDQLSRALEVLKKVGKRMGIIS